MPAASSSIAAAWQPRRSRRGKRQPQLLFAGARSATSGSRSPTALSDDAVHAPVYPTV